LNDDEHLLSHVVKTRMVIQLNHDNNSKEKARAGVTGDIIPPIIEEP
jgi:hypothetical protein